MTKLPATLVESEALAFAREFITGLDRSGGPWSGHSPFSDVESRAFVRQRYREAALLSAVNRLQLMAMARAGDLDARDVLHALMIEAKSRGEELPIELEGYNMEVLHGEMGHQSPGPKKKNRFTRHMFIALTVAAVVDRFGLDPTGRSPHRRSACSIVAEALQVIGLRLGSAAVEKIWKKYRGGMPTMPGWATAWMSAF